MIYREYTQSVIASHSCFCSFFTSHIHQNICKMFLFTNAYKEIWDPAIREVLQHERGGTKTQWIVVTT